MIETIFNMFTAVFVESAGWFEKVLYASGVVGIFLSVVFLVLLSNFLLRPIFGSAGSDKVSKRKNGGFNNE